MLDGPHQEYSKKATGSSVARVNLDLDGASNTSVVMEPGLAVCEGFKHNEFCIICRDGSVEDDYLLLCDECPRVVCSQLRHGAPSLHTGHHVTTCDLPYTMASIETRSCYSTPSSQSVPPSNYLLRYCGRGIRTGLPFFEALFPNGGLVYQEVMFDVGTVSKVKTYQASVDNLVRTLSTNNWKRVVFGISNHTNNTHGDPFVGYDKNKYVATPVDNFLDIILAPWQVLVDHAAESFLWFFSCGALVNNAESFSKLRVSVARHGLSAAVALNAVQFQPNFAAHFLLAFSDLVLIQRLSMRDAFPDMLGQSYMLGRHSDVFLLTGHKASRLFLSVIELTFWLRNIQSQNRSRVIKKIRKAIVAAHKEQGSKVTLPSSLKKAIKQYYADEVEDEESDGEEATKEREISARPKEASFYKKKLTDWDVAQKLFKQQIDEFDKAEQARKGDKDPIKFRTRHAQEWFNKMTPAQKKQVEYAREKWNKEGAPEESQVIYHKNNLKKVLEEFSEQLR
ncbi:hypothetical protein DFJ58DRAFT_733799 [Suillus subalutaceus]|uniref:uncharacterized protein n=1 Tax=Suillus subalutaceus TaxID=48586 RepID=UPI001B85CD43|nr:uncharacterized protein DFJ58DRAFT_733799 [Suillus subalutaceus]KAG1838548.1 hypothetical protein DFJ58DRAFT_733799 [Suillus subalutaceus]